MSREERRAYKRMTRNQDPYALPASAAQRVRAQQKQRSRRSSRSSPQEFRFVTGRFLIWGAGGALMAGLLAFSLVWPRMPLALYAGAAALVGWSALAWLLRWFQSRAAARR